MLGRDTLFLKSGLHYFKMAQIQKMRMQDKRFMTIQNKRNHTSQF